MIKPEHAALANAIMRESEADFDQAVEIAAKIRHHLSKEGFELSSSMSLTLSPKDEGPARPSWCQCSRDPEHGLDFICDGHFERGVNNIDEALPRPSPTSEVVVAKIKAALCELEATHDYHLGDNPGHRFPIPSEIRREYKAGIAKVRALLESLSTGEGEKVRNDWDNAPQDGSVILVCDMKAETPEWGEAQWVDGEWRCFDYDYGVEGRWPDPTHWRFKPDLPALSTPPSDKTA